MCLVLLCLPPALGDKNIKWQERNRVTVGHRLSGFVFPGNVDNQLSFSVSR